MPALLNTRPPQILNLNPYANPKTLNPQTVGQPVCRAEGNEEDTRKSSKD